MKHSVNIDLWRISHFNRKPFFDTVTEFREQHMEKFYSINYRCVLLIGERFVQEKDRKEEKFSFFSLLSDSIQLFLGTYPMLSDFPQSTTHSI